MVNIEDCIRQYFMYIKESIIKFLETEVTPFK